MLYTLMFAMVLNRFILCSQTDGKFAFLGTFRLSDTDLGYVYLLPNF